MIHGSVSAVIFQNPENGYTVLRLNTIDGEQVTVVGIIPLIALGERLIITGRWSTHSTYGRQFEAELLERLMPETEHEILLYLASGILKGVGGKTAQRLVAEFGIHTLEVLEKEPERLTVVPGISSKKAGELSRSFQRQVGMRRLMEFLMEHKLPAELAMPLYRIFGEGAMETIEENPYVLTEEEFGASFSQVDMFAMEMGLDADDTRRVEAGLLFELEYNLGNGHTFLPRNKLLAATGILLDLEESVVTEAFLRLCEQKRVETDILKGIEICYLPAYYAAECEITQRLQKMTREPAHILPNLEEMITEAERDNGIVYAPQQRDAIAAAARYAVTVITGGPGTGKTTTLRGILDIFDKLEITTMLAAPTGRAAKRLTELTGREATTIHRLLEAQYSQQTGKLAFFRDAQDPLDCDALVIDETSMVDVLLMQSVLDALPVGAKLVLVGDPDQLPSVGAGNFFSDLIRSKIAPTVRLTEIFRQARQSLIVMNAHSVNCGVMPELGVKDRDFFFMRRSSAEDVVQTIRELCAVRLPKNMGIDPWDIQVLSPTKKYETGTYRLNQVLQEALNPALDGKREKQFGNFVFREGDRVMQIRNNYDILWKTKDGKNAGAGIFNGDIGKIRSIDFSMEQMEILFDDRITQYEFSMLAELEPAYAMTVHKSQGSEYRAVILTAWPGSPKLLTRNVLYTAITRAKELLIIVGNSDVIAAMTENNLQQKRYSGLKLRLEQGGEVS